MKKVLIVMATYNGEKYLQDQLESIFNQVGIAVFLTVNDDCSTDNTIKVLEAFKQKGYPIEISKNTQNMRSAGLNFLKALTLIKNPNDFDLIALADQDDLWHPEKISAADRMLTESESMLYMSDLTKWNSNTNKKTLLKKSYSQKTYDHLFEGGSAGCTYVFSRDFYFALMADAEKRTFNAWRNFSHDWYIYFFARQNNYKVYIDNVPYIYYRIHDNNVHGYLNSFSWRALSARLNLVREGWYFNHIAEFKKMIPETSPQFKIYSLYTGSLWSRITILLKFNFHLMRSPVKFVIFFMLSLIPVKNLLSGHNRNV